VLARAAAAVGIDALYVEVHDNPRWAKSDGPNALTFDLLEEVLADVVAIDRLVTGRGQEGAA
jgi:2-dehydro-3-deoxyphosphooctonate aldolase (KDO 8-P synthase)